MTKYLTAALLALLACDRATPAQRPAHPAKPAASGEAASPKASDFRETLARHVRGGVAYEVTYQVRGAPGQRDLVITTRIRNVTVEDTVTVESAQGGATLAVRGELLDDRGGRAWERPTCGVAAARASTAEAQPSADETGPRIGSPAETATASSVRARRPGRGLGRGRPRLACVGTGFEAVLSPGLGAPFPPATDSIRIARMLGDSLPAGRYRIRIAFRSSTLPGRYFQDDPVRVDLGEVELAP